MRRPTCFSILSARVTNSSPIERIDLDENIYIAVRTLLHPGV